MPQVAPERSGRVRVAWAAWGVGLSVALLLVGMILLAPAARGNGWSGLSLVLYQAFRPLCHQVVERSFHLEGFPLAVCARCTGLYAGALAGLLIYPVARAITRQDAPRREWLILAALPTGADFALGLFGLWENTHASRFSTALVLGATTAFYVVPGLVGLGASLRAGRLFQTEPSRGG